ncbi:hypothetical protein SLE2022_253770 [Rubroshorea leprosula]
MAFSMENIVVYIALFHLSIVIAEIPTCQLFGSPNLAPDPKVDSPALPNIPPAGLPKPCQATEPEAGSPALSPIPPANSPSKESRGRVFDVTEYGAVADGEKESSSAFLAAWKAACNYAGNATFLIPEGIFLLGPISFDGPCLNNLSPNIEIRGTLLAPGSLDAFPSSAWIAFRNLYGFNLTGSGTGKAKIDGKGEVEAWKRSSCEKSMNCNRLVASLYFFEVSHATISNITLANSKGFHLNIYVSDNIDVYNVNISAPPDSPNTDGVHIGESSNITIASSTIGVGDDCVSIGPGSINISVSGIQCGPGHGISIGSLGKYKNEKDVIGIKIENCTINGTQNGVRVKTWPGSPPGRASNITFQDISMTNVSNPIIIDQDYCPSSSCNKSKPSMVKLTDILIKNITGTYNTKSAVSLLCSSGVPCQNIHLVDIKLNYTGPELGRLALGHLSTRGNVKGLKISNSKF